MTDPLSLIALGAAVGGAAGKFVEKAWDSGEKWLIGYFANHRERAQEAARENAAEFLNDLAQEISEKSTSGQIPAEQIEEAQDHPDFSATLQAALLTAAQTDNAEKKKLLARVIAERLASGPETTLGVASKMACDAIAFATPNQLRILGLQANLLMIKPTRSLPANEYNAWLVVRLSPYMTLSIAQLDLLHLEAISCGAVVQFLGRDLIQALRVKNGDIFDEGMLTSAGILPRLVPLWNERLERFNLTSVGQIIGILVSDIVSGGKTSLERWGA